ncbi:MAG: hypothetical protein AAF658_13040, partial [Myxococcota bacterium]
MRISVIFFALGAVALTGCGNATVESELSGSRAPDLEFPSDENAPPATTLPPPTAGDAPTDPGDLITMSGTVRAVFDSNLVTESLDVQVPDLTPAPTITAEGGSFQIAGLPAGADFSVQTAATGFVPTLTGPFNFDTNQVARMIHTLSQERYAAWLDRLVNQIGVPLEPAASMLIVRVRDTDRRAVEGYPLADLTLSALASGPYFIGPSGNLSNNRTESADNGLAVWFNATPGAATVSSLVGSNRPLQPTSLDLRSGGIHYAEVTAGSVPTVSFVARAQTLIDDSPIDLGLSVSVVGQPQVTATPGPSGVTLENVYLDTEAFLQSEAAGHVPTRAGPYAIGANTVALAIPIVSQVTLQQWAAAVPDLLLDPAAGTIVIRVLGADGEGLQNFPVDQLMISPEGDGSGGGMMGGGNGMGGG